MIVMAPNVASSTSPLAPSIMGAAQAQVALALSSASPALHAQHVVFQAPQPLVSALPCTAGKQPIAVPRRRASTEAHGTPPKPLGGAAGLPRAAARRVANGAPR